MIGYWARTVTTVQPLSCRRREYYFHMFSIAFTRIHVFCNLFMA